MDGCTEAIRETKSAVEPLTEGSAAPARSLGERMRTWERARILVIDDDQTNCEMLEFALKREHRVTWRTSAHSALELFATEDFDVVLTDLNMAELGGIELCQRATEMRPDVPVVVITGNGTMIAAIAAIRAGAYDFVNKPVDGERLRVTVRRAFRLRRLRDEVKRLRLDACTAPAFEEMLGTSDAMKHVFELVSRVARSDATVLIEGESGTGKELVARAVHAQSSRRDQPFLAINCAAMTPSLLESELFGHARGAFTDAKTAHAGLFEQASGGTLFLDEIGELPLEMQPKLLRALQEHRVRPVGANHEVPFDARIVAATNRHLERDVSAGRFRADLYYRINVVAVTLPPLRERPGDILALAQHFVERAVARSGSRVAGIDASTAEKLCSYDWPGNVRELENCMERAVALARFDTITVDDLAEKIRNYRSDRIVIAADNLSELVTMSELESQYFARVLTLVGGNKSRAAKILGVHRRTLYRKAESTRTRGL